MTEKLYDKNAYLFEFDAQVLSCTETKRGFETILDRTAFFPEEGGQDCDSGMIGGARVNHVSLLGNKIVHLTAAVFLNGLQNMRMGTEHDVRTGVNGGVTHLLLFFGGVVCTLHAPMGDEDD